MSRIMTVSPCISLVSDYSNLSATWRNGLSLVWVYRHAS